MLVTGSKEGQIVIWDLRCMYQISEHNGNNSMFMITIIYFDHYLY